MVDKGKGTERIEAERLLDLGLYSEDPIVSKQMYELFKQRFANSIVRSDQRDIRTERVLKGEKIVHASSFKGKGRYLREVEHPREEYREYQVRVIEEPYPKSCLNNGKLLSQK